MHDARKVVKQIIDYEIRTSSPAIVELLLKLKKLFGTHVQSMSEIDSILKPIFDQTTKEWNGFTDADLKAASGCLLFDQMTDDLSAIDSLTELHKNLKCDLGKLFRDGRTDITYGWADGEQERADERMDRSTDGRKDKNMIFLISTTLNDKQKKMFSSSFLDKGKYIPEFILKKRVIKKQKLIETLATLHNYVTQKPQPQFANETVQWFIRDKYCIIKSKLEIDQVMFCSYYQCPDGVVEAKG